MKNVLLELWMENKNHPWQLIGKIAVLFLALFAGIMVPGFTFTLELVFSGVYAEIVLPSFVFTYVIVTAGVLALDGNQKTLSEEAGGVWRMPEMVYLVPRSLYGMRQHELQKSITKAVFYASITIFGYGIMAGCTAGLSLDREMLPLILLFIYQVMMFYHYYLEQLLVTYHNIRQRHTGILFVYLLAGILLAGLCYYQFTGYSMAAFLKNPFWWLAGTAVMIGILMILFLQIRKDRKRLVISDYK